MDPGKIRALLVCQPECLDRVANTMEVSPQDALEIRNQATSLILGRCALCNGPAPLGVCSTCKEKHNQNLLEWSGAAFLQQLKPATVILKRTCAECNRPIALSASYLLWKLLRRPNSPTKRLCKACLRKRAGKRRQEPTAVPQSLVGRLTHNPFGNHPSLTGLKKTLFEEKLKEGALISEKPESFRVKERWTGKSPVSTLSAPGKVQPEELMPEQHAEVRKQPKSAFSVDAVLQTIPVLEELRTSSSSAETQRILKANAPLLRRATSETRAIERLGLPAYAQFLSWAEERSLFDKVRLARDLVLTSVAGIAVWKAGKHVWQYFRA